MFLLIDKPKGITSHDVVDQLRRITSEKRIGHAGTLDPSATGLLIVGVGRESTKRLGEITTGTTKTYKAEITLGAQSSTGDSEGEITSNEVAKIPGNLEIKNSLHSFVGEQLQTPPQYSAIKIKGKKAYEFARAGKEVKLEPRKVNIFSINLAKYVYPTLSITCEVSAGTYIRSLARDIGGKLSTGGYLSNLRRTKIGEMSVEDAVRLELLDESNFRHFLRDYPGVN